MTIVLEVEGPGGDSPGLCELQGDPRTVLVMLELGKGQARTPMSSSTVAGRQGTVPVLMPMLCREMRGPRRC